jgi:ubiquitin carboxyl-terminal hydrolase L5
MQSSRSTPGERSPPHTPQETADKDDQDPASSKRTGLRRKREDPKEPDPNPMEAAMKPLTDEERRSWPGWVELESEPVSTERAPFLSFFIYLNEESDGNCQTLFNYILREYGVKDVKIQEVFSLDDESLNFLPYVTFIHSP